MKVNKKFLRDCLYAALMQTAVEWIDMHRHQSLAGSTHILLFKYIYFFKFHNISLL